MAVPVLLPPVAVVTRVARDGFPVVVPWRTIGLVVVAVPLLAAAVRVSTATFD